MIREICVIGFPSRVGGADTELDHQIRVWQALGLQVHLLHTGRIDDNLRSMRMDERGCVIHEPRDWSRRQGMHVISYCNGEFLKHLPEIRRHTRSATFVNCMTWLFDAEKEAHRKGLIDCFLYQTDHARERVQDDLKKVNEKFRKGGCGRSAAEPTAKRCRVTQSRLAGVVAQAKPPGERCRAVECR